MGIVDIKSMDLFILEQKWYLNNRIRPAGPKSVRIKTQDSGTNANSGGKARYHGFTEGVKSYLAFSPLRIESIRPQISLWSEQ